MNLSKQPEGDSTGTNIHKINIDGESFVDTGIGSVMDGETINIDTILKPQEIIKLNPEEKIIKLNPEEKIIKLNLEKRKGITLEELISLLSPLQRKQATKLLLKLLNGEII